MKVWRKLLGISQEQLAERSNLHRTYISDVERGVRNLSLISMEKLAAALQIPISSFFDLPEVDGERQCIRQPCNLKTKFAEVLLVEDNADDVALTLHAFKKARLANQISIVRDGAAALDYLFYQGEYAQRSPASHPQIILLDLNLPTVSGIEVLRRVKADRATRACAVVVLTVSARGRDIEECIRLGADGYIIKPVDFQSLSRTTPQLNLEWALLKPLPQNMPEIPVPTDGRG